MFILKRLPIYNKVLLFLLLIITLNYFFFNYRLIFRQNAYIAGDWLINYQGGFIRRGFFGEIIFFVTSNFNIPILNLVFFFSSFFFLLFIFFYYYCVKNYLKFNFLLLYLFLPSTLLFTFFDVLAIGRKESLVLLFVSLYNYFLLKNLNHKFVIQIILSFLIIFITLSHEIMFFYMPYIFAIKILFLNNARTNFNNLKNFKLEFFLFFISSICIFLIFFFSHLHDNNLLCESLLNLKLNDSICGAVIADYKGRQQFSIIFPYFFERNYFATYGLITTLNFLPILVYFFLQKKTKKNFSTISIYVVLSFFCFIFTAPIFLIVNDWGRYLNIHFINQGLLFALILKNNSDTFQLNFKKKHCLKKLMIISVIIFYLTTWFMPHCCRAEIGDGYKSIYNRIYVRLYDESHNTSKYGTDYPKLFLKKILNLN
jgi:hypothetical protein